MTLKAINSMKVSNEVREKLISLKLCDTESFNSVIERLLEKFK